MWITILLVGLTAGCSGGAARHTVSQTPAAATTTTSKPTLTARQRRELAHLRADLRRLKIAAAPIHHSLMGTPKLMALNGKFLDDEERSTLDNLTKNRLIDLAASTVAGACDQCFQQLEAARPIVQVAHPGK